jgi:metal-responsive CopG/Arc/MetJ family transcriptional regulator
MGRPPLGIKPVNVQLSPELLARMDAILGGKKHARSAFIRTAVEAELARRESFTPPAKD